MEWLEGAGYEPVPMLDLESLARDLDSRPIEALIADVALTKSIALPNLMKALTANRPLILIGDRGTAPPHIRRDASWLDRPTTYDEFRMIVALALAEGRPARRSPRKSVTRLHATVDGVSAEVVDISAEGVRLLLHNALPSALAPYFTMRVPGFGVAIVVKRVWVTQPSRGSVLCGGIIERALPKSKGSWKDLLETAPSSGEFVTQSVDYS